MEEMKNYKTRDEYLDDEEFDEEEKIAIGRALFQAIELVEEYQDTI